MTNRDKTPFVEIAVYGMVYDPENDSHTLADHFDNRAPEFYDIEVKLICPATGEIDVIESFDNFQTDARGQDMLDATVGRLETKYNTDAEYI